MAGGLKLQDLNWGMCTDLYESNQAQITGDPRRTDPLMSWKRLTQVAYSKDCIGNRTDYDGFVVGFQQQEFATFQNQAQMFQAWVYFVPGTGKGIKEYENVAYKVYIPELMPQGPPKSTDDAATVQKLLATYPDVYSALDFKEAIPKGSFVTVRYDDPVHLRGPKIVKIIERAVGVVGLSTDASGNPLESAFLDGMPTRLPPFGPGEGETAKQTTTTTPPAAPTGPAKGPYTYIPTGELIDNAKLPPHILKGVTINGTLIYILKDMETDLMNMIAKYESVFQTKFEVNNSYRTYEEQNRLYKQNCYDGNYRAATNKGNVGTKRPRIKYTSKSGKERSRSGCRPLTAYPGKSRHGWAAAVDIQSTRMFGSSANDAKIITLKYRWLNRYGEDYNFQFNVSGEAWHMAWLKVDEFISGLEPARAPWSKNGRADGQASLIVQNKDAPV